MPFGVPQPLLGVPAKFIIFNTKFLVFNAEFLNFTHLTRPLIHSSSELARMFTSSSAAPKNDTKNIRNDFRSASKYSQIQH